MSADSTAIALEYNSLVTNPMPDPTTKVAGGVSGIVNLKQGDTLDFECEIINMTDKNFFGANEAADDEMCILTAIPSVRRCRGVALRSRRAK